MHATVRQLPDEPRVDSPERELALRDVRAREQPLELGRREVRIGHEPRPRADQISGKLATAIGGAPVLPDDRGRNRRSRRALPEDGRLALIRDPDRAQLRRTDAGGSDGGLGGADDSRPDLLRVVLDPARPREMLAQLHVAAPADVEVVVDDEAGRSRRPLVDREDHANGLSDQTVTLPRCPCCFIVQPSAARSRNDFVNGRLGSATSTSPPSFGRSSSSSSALRRS